MKRILCFLITIFTIISESRPMVFSGRVLDLSNTGIENSQTKFNVKITNPLDCVLYEEEFILDMSGSNGYFKIALQSGTPVFNANSLDIFRLKSNFCKDGSSWTSSQNDNRKVFLSLKLGDQPWVDFSSDTINSVAYSQEAEFLRGKSPNDFIQSSSTSTQSAFDSLMLKQDDLINLANGSNTIYAKQDLMDLALNNKQNILNYSPINPANNLSELTNKAQSRINLGLGLVSIKDKVSDSDITNVGWSKLLDKPLTFPPSSHNHPINEIDNLLTTLSSKIDKASLSCSSTQIITYISVSDSFSCIDISVQGDISGSIADTSLTKIQGKDLVINNPQDGMTIRFNGNSNRWEGTNASPSTIPKAFAGEIITFSANCPVGTILADGSTLTTSANQDLYNVIGCTYGCPTPNVTFKIPDYRGMFLRGKNNGRSDGLENPDGDSALGTYQGDDNKLHNHTINDNGHGHSVVDHGHIHSLLDPGHNHSITDPGHNHNITDPGHKHIEASSGVNLNLRYGVTTSTAANLRVEGGTSTENAGFTSTETTGISIQNRTTGISVLNRTTGITVEGHTTGISILSQTTGITINNNGSESRPKNITVNYCIRTQNAY